MAWVDCAPAFERTGVVAGFVLSIAAGAAVITKGVLFAQGAMYRPATAPAIPDAGLGVQFLFYNSVGGFYWRNSKTPDAADDAFVGWVNVSAGVTSSERVKISDEEMEAAPAGPGTVTGPGLNAYGDVDVPPAPVFGVGLAWGSGTAAWGLAVWSALSFEVLDNAHSVGQAELWLWYVDETGSAQGTLTADISDADTTVHLSDVNGLETGSYLLVDREVMEVSAVADDHVVVARGALGTTAAAHTGPKNITGATNAAPIAITAAGHGKIAYNLVSVSGVSGNTAANGTFEVYSVSGNDVTLAGSSGNGNYTAGGVLAGASAWLLQRKVALASFAPEFFPSAAAGEWEQGVDLPAARIAAAECKVTNAWGESETTTTPYTGNVNEGLRTLRGGQIAIAVEGVLGVESDAAPEAVVPYGQRAREVYALVQTAPSGGAVRCTVKVNGTAWCELVIETGATMSGVRTGRALTALTSGAKLTLDVTAVGATFPGERLVVVIRL